MESLYRLKDLLDKEIDKVVSKGEVSPAEIKPLGELIDIYKDIETICAMKEYGQEDDQYSMENRGYSTRRMSRYPGMYRDSYSYENSYDNMRYENNRSNGRNSYGGHVDKDEMIYKLEQMMNTAKNDKERMAYVDAIESLKHS